MSAPEALTLAGAAEALETGRETSVSLTRTSLARISSVDPKVHAFISVLGEDALRQAARLDAERAAGKVRSRLHGIPVAVKDNIDVGGVVTTAHSRLMAGAVARGDADLVARLRKAGAVILGKTALHEFARGGPLDELAWPNAKNPWNAGHTCGGSSSGSGVAVSAGMVGMAVGTDTGGSIRYPAACVGIVGLKPTYGLVSRRGIFPLSFSLDAAGPMTRTVEDCAIAMEVLAGHDPHDPGSAARPVPDYVAALSGTVAGLRIGYAHDYDAASGVTAEQASAVSAAAERLGSLGAVVRRIALPPRRVMDAATWTILLAEGFAVHHQMLRERPMDYGRITRERLTLGAFVTGHHLVQAQRWRRYFTDAFDRLFDDVDVILCSSANGPAVPMEKVDANPWRHTHPITAPFNLTGHPALAIPAGFSEAGLPLSLSLVGRHFDEASILRAGHAYQIATSWHEARPDF